jgi:hypothetical protein
MEVGLLRMLKGRSLMAPLRRVSPVLKWEEFNDFYKSFVEKGENERLV